MKRITITLLIMSMMTLVGCSGLATGIGNVEKDEAKSEATLESMEIKTANDALERLKKGNEQYVKDAKETIDVSKERRAELENGQNPFAVILSCSDSRVVTSHIFNTGLGDIFDIKLAGNVVDDLAIGSIEYGVEHLGVPLLVVMGHSESASRSKYERKSESPKISKQTVVSPIIDWIDYDVWLYILTTKIDFNQAYRLGWTRVGCWCCPNNGGWSEFLAKVHMYDQYAHWHDLLVDFARQIGKPDPEEYISEGGWKARQGGNGLAAAQTSVVSFEPCATDENAFNYILQRPITEELYELFKPFGYINKELGNKRLGEVYVMNKAGKVVLVLQGRIGNNKLKVIIKDIHIAKAKTLAAAEGKIQCQLTKYQMCLGCKACESVCKYDAISVKDNGAGDITYCISDEKCRRCTECVGHFNAGCYMRKVLTIKRT